MLPFLRDKTRKKCCCCRKFTKIYDDEDELNYENARFLKLFSSNNEALKTRKTSQLYQVSSEEGSSLSSDLSVGDKI